MGLPLRHVGAILSGSSRRIYWAELVRSTSTTMLIESASGNQVWLRTSDGEPLEQEFASRIPTTWSTIPDDDQEPDFLTFATRGWRFRFRKAGAAWIPSNSGIYLPDVPWNGSAVYRFFEGVYP